MQKCLFCNDELEETIDGEGVHEGGVIAFYFSFGSTKFDKCMGTTIYSAFICDKCASQYVDKMEETLLEL